MFKREVGSRKGHFQKYINSISASAYAKTVSSKPMWSNMCKGRFMETNVPFVRVNNPNETTKNIRKAKSSMSSSHSTTDSQKGISVKKRL